MEEKLKRRKNREIVLARRLRKRPNILHTQYSSTTSSPSDDTVGFDNTATPDTTPLPLQSKRLTSILSSSPGAFSYTSLSSAHDTLPQGTRSVLYCCFG